MAGKCAASSRPLLWATLSMLLVLGPAQAKDPSFSNPVIAGDYPDPSAIPVRGVFWGTATSSEWGPYFPILQSRDLVNWKIVGNVFERRPEWTVGNFWAPEIAEHKGRYFMYYVARKKDGPLSVAVASADKPEGPYQDHGPLVSQAAGSIDAVTTLDENGQLYMLWKEDGNSRKLPTPIWAQPLSEDGLKLTGHPKELIRNDQPWEANLVEGPFVLKRNGFFYLFYSGNACCGRGCNYGLGVARSKALLGPWEKNPANPILIGNDTWKCPGHGSIISVKGKDYLFYHAYHAKDFVYVGRQALLDEITWRDNGWPEINGGKGPSTNALAPFAVANKNLEKKFEDNFSGKRLKLEWQWPQGDDPIVELQSGWLSLPVVKSGPEEFAGGVLAVRTTTGQYTATTRLEVPGAGLRAGLAAYGDRENAIGLSISDGEAIVWRRHKKTHQNISTHPLPKKEHLHIRLRAEDGHRFAFSFSEDGRKWQQLGADIPLEGDYLPPWDRGIRVALIVGGKAGATARFDSLLLEPAR